jgi:hypothetical protein
MVQHQKLHISRISNEHTDWNRGAAFYLDELNILNHRLQDFAVLYFNDDAKAQVEHFQNQFIVQRNNLEEMKKKIKMHEHHLSKDTIEHAQHLTKETLAEHDNLRIEYMDLIKIVVELKNNFYKFLATYM